MTSQDICFHCGEPLQGSELSARIQDRNVRVCCHGCLAVVQLIAGTGLTDYYRLREVAGMRPDATATRADKWEALSRPEVAAQFTHSSGELEATTLAVDGLRCPACGWLIDRVLKSMVGVQEATTNAATGRTHVSWCRNQLTLADIARAIAMLGYQPHPLADDSALQLQQQERRDALKRLAVAGFGMMQVMMFAVAGYSAELAGEVMEPGLAEFFRIVSLLVATPVLLYAAAPIFAGACRNVETRTIGMDLPVAAALGLAYVASVWNTFLDPDSHVYFDSVTMFIFFLTLGRFVQMAVRHRTTGITDALARQLPGYAHRLVHDRVEDVSVSALRRGDVLIVRHGEVIPVDGELLDQAARVDESLLTGESLPVHRRAGDRLIAGTLNIDNPLQLRVTAGATAATLSHIVSLLRRAHAQRPVMARAADVAAARFLSLVLVGAAGTCALWLAIDPARAFEATLSVLVVACPCAFAIASPAAISAATSHLARYGVLVTRVDALETLARIDRMVFDKTGTLTHGDIAVRRCLPLGSVGETECMNIAAALEVQSEHPLARAFARFGTDRRAHQVRTVAGAGLEGNVDGRRYRIGTADFVAALRGESSPPTTMAELAGTLVVLGDEQCDLALFELHDIPRKSAVSAVGSLASMGISAQILSGDRQRAVAALAEYCSIPEHFGRRSPEQKLAHVQLLQAQGHQVAMVGDGVNDAPVLAAADVSIAMGHGAALAHASADMILLGENLDSLARAVKLARKTLRIARQNLVWSAVYNFGSLPLAALGLIPPWLAALGMSLSSIAVVLNASRLLPRPAQPHSAVNASGHVALRPPVAAEGAAP